MPKVIHKEYIPLATLILLTIISALALTPLHTSAEDGGNSADNASADIGVNVALACTLSGSNTSHAITLNNGSYNDNITGTTLHTICNGSGNYNIYAIGYTNNTDGNNTLDGKTSGTIPTGTTLDGTTSNWAMKLANSTGNTATIENGYSSFSVIPSTSTLVASYNATSNQTTDSTLQTTYGVSISPNQPAGTYTGQVKYTMDYSAYVPSYYMQDFTLARCQTEAADKEVVLYDRRDNSDYTVRYINGACWMTQNLRITGTIESTDSNFVGDSVNISVRDLTAGSSYTEPRTHTGTDNNGDPTVWYNFCAASAKSNGGCTDSASYVSDTDICPAGWRLPTNSEQFDVSGYSGEYKPVTGGYYSNGAPNMDWSGFWWSSTAYDTSYQSVLEGDSSPYLSAGSNNAKRAGDYIRCVRTS